METLAVHFRCAKDGSRFRVVLTRDAANAKYHVYDVKAGTSLMAGGTVTKSVVTAGDSGGLPSGLVDWSGWYCAICHYGASDAALNESLFVQCSQCGNLVCGAEITISADGGHVFHCYPACGDAGLIGGHIDRYEAQPQAPSPEALAGGSQPKELARGDASA